MARRWTLLLLFFALTSGCSDETSSSSAPAPQPEAIAELSAEDLAPFTDVTPHTDDTPAADALEPEQPKKKRPLPANTGAVLSAEAPEGLEAWVADTEATPQVRLASLQRLAAVAPERALASAKALIDDPETEPLLRSNAVAVLARSEDPKADAHIAGLEPKYQRLAQALRNRKER